LNGFETFVAWRYLLTKKKTGFISIISVISIAGISLGVAALIIVLSLMNGFTKEIRTRLLGMDGHIWVTAPLDPKTDFGSFFVHSGDKKSSGECVIHGLMQTSEI